MFKVVDLFAGPGGLGEGFSSWKDRSGRRPFRLATSVEMDPYAHATLRLRAFRRTFDNRPPDAYHRFVRGEIGWDQLAAAQPKGAKVAAREAVQLELSRATVPTVTAMLERTVHPAEPWVLIGGPPCQAYSLVGRARNKGKKEYVPDLDHRQTLYVEYLQILADHAPPVFVMENVTGLLSATLASQALFDRIRADLAHPASALHREGRPWNGQRPQYEVRALAPEIGLSDDDPMRYVVRSEHFGIPQSRHRVILLGVRTDLSAGPEAHLDRARGLVSLDDALQGLPRLRSGLSRMEDTDTTWLTAMRGVRGRNWLAHVERPVREGILNVLGSLSVPRRSRGLNVFQNGPGGTCLNHSTRSHILPDLERYLFASSYARVHHRSPLLRDFPKGLLPSHANVARGVRESHFADRFRVQLDHEPATTVTSHIAKDGHYYIHPDPTQCRSLTVREAARLQSFPDDYFFCGPRTQQYRQVGNAVPPRLAAQIAQVVAAILES